MTETSRRDYNWPQQYRGTLGAPADNRSVAQFQNRVSRSRMTRSRINEIGFMRCPNSRHARRPKVGFPDRVKDCLISRYNSLLNLKILVLSRRNLTLNPLILATL